MKNNAGIIHACSVEENGGGQLLTGSEISKALAEDRLAWVHLDGSDAESRNWLQREITYLDQIILDALLAEETRPRVLEFEQGLLLILRGINLNKDEQPEDMISIRLWIDEHRIISIEKRPLRAVKDLLHRQISGKGSKSAGDFLTMLTTRMFERMEPMFLKLDEDLDDIEEIVMEDPDKRERQGITSIRKQAITYRRYIAPQRDVLSYIRTSEISWMGPTHRRRIQESLDRVVRYLEDLDMIRERAQIIKDELANGLADKMNKNMYVLSVVAAVFLPLGFFTGLLGINIGGIPGSDNNNAFLIFCGILVLIVIFQVGVFKKFKWF